MGPESYEDLRRAIHDPEVVHAMLEDYRAGLGVDREHEEADRAAGRKLACPVLLVWATRDDTEELDGVFSGLEEMVRKGTEPGEPVVRRYNQKKWRYSSESEHAHAKEGGDAGEGKPHSFSGQVGKLVGKPRSRTRR